jgi:hypothetical protein
VAAYAPEVRLADDVDAFEREVDAALRGPRDHRAARASMLAGEDWDLRAEVFLSMIERAVRGRVAPTTEAPRCV